MGAILVREVTFPMRRSPNIQFDRVTAAPSGGDHIVAYFEASTPATDEIHGFERAMSHADAICVHRQPAPAITSRHMRTGVLSGEE